MLAGNAVIPERPVRRRWAELTRNDELFLKILNDYYMEYDMSKPCVLPAL